MRLGRTLCLLVPWGYALACGGRFEKTVGGDEPDGGTSPATGATASSGGTTSTAGSTSKAGSVSRGGNPSGAGSSAIGGTPAAGSTSVGGAFGTAGAVSIGGGFSTAGIGGACICAPAGCTPPFREVADQNGCCTHCELDLKLCLQAEQGYQMFKAQVVQKYQTLGCMSDGDCGLLFDKNECGYGACGAPLPNGEIQSAMQALNSYAQTNCNFACPPGLGPQPMCNKQTSPRCVMSHCQ